MFLMYVAIIVAVVIIGGEVEYGARRQQAQMIDLLRQMKEIESYLCHTYNSIKEIETLTKRILNNGQRPPRLRI